MTILWRPCWCTQQKNVVATLLLLFTNMAAVTSHLNQELFTYYSIEQYVQRTNLKYMLMTINSMNKIMLKYTMQMKISEFMIYNNNSHNNNNNKNMIIIMIITIVVIYLLGHNTLLQKYFLKIF